MVHVATTSSTVQDIEMTDTIHDELAERQLLPAEHVVDSRYRGLVRTHVQHVLTAMACNIARVAD
ncbi:hypothetical protein ACFV7R_45420 [Streptomyces sp. NPDC059866]|uniref:hypothetical protein n=1 Tax=Streptomyces sp. NPDC059866 TaxID=3346978 RepID=UPI0036549885